MAQPTMQPTSDQYAEDVAELKVANIMELVQQVRCGRYKWMACLCDSRIRYAMKLLDQRLTPREQLAFFTELCGCTLPTPNAPQGGTTNTSLPVPPAATPTPNTPPAATCDPALPAANSWADSFISGG